MNTYEQVRLSGSVARVRAVADNGYCLYLELRNGSIVTVNAQETFDFEVGSVVLVRLEENDEGSYIEAAPDDLWVAEPWVGVVRLVTSDKTIVDASGHWRLVSTPDDIALRVGNTVEVQDSLGIVRVLSEKPIRYLDPPTVDDDIISKFVPRKGGRPETFADFGGLQDVVARARELVEVPLQRKEELSKIGARPIKGVLFTGPPGTGKTMLARIIANNTDAKFYEVSGPQIFSKWYGESEQILRKLFEHAAKQEQAIIFFDEIDSVAGQRAEESHEASRRVVAQLLTLMDGFTSDDNVVVIAATNRPQDIDAALRRPGRFDWEIPFPLPARGDRESILRLSAQRLSTIDPLPHAWIAHNTEQWSGAELAAIWSEAALLAASDGRAVIMAEDYVEGFKRVSAQRRRVAPRSPLGGDAT